MESLEDLNAIEVTAKKNKKQNSAICDQCGKSLANIYILRAHKDQVHKGIKRFACDICHLKFGSKNHLHRHQLGVHSENRNYHCEMCGHSFKTRNVLIKHQRTHFRGMGPFVCRLCDQTFKFKSGLDHHNKLKHTIKAKESSEGSLMLYKCFYCEKLYKTIKHLREHEKFHQSDEPIKCSEQSCTKIFESSKDLSRHVKNIHRKPVIFTCDYCLKTYKTKSNFEIHISSHEREEDMQEYQYFIESKSDEFQLEEEPESIIDHNDLIGNIGLPESLLKNIDEDLVQIVKIESETFVVEVLETDEEEPVETLDSLDHLIEEEAEDFLIERDCETNFYETVIAEEIESPSFETDDIEDQDYNDTIIHEEVENCHVEELMSVQEHQSTTNRSKNSSGDKQSICDECGSKFKNNSHLKRHIQRKHRKDAYKLECDVCGTKFLLKYDLKRHMIKHSSRREHSCDQCQQQFKTEMSLKNHIKVLHNQNHLKLERNFSCQFCERSYFHQRHLQYHLRKHTGDQRYKCELCKPEKFFYYSDAVKWHKIRQHEQPAPYNCSICNKKFIHERSWQTHEKEHQDGNGSLQVICPICEKFVSEKRHLKRHMRGHARKEFQCKCGNSFKERFQLTK